MQNERKKIGSFQLMGVFVGFITRFAVLQMCVCVCVWSVDTCCAHIQSSLSGIICTIVLTGPYSGGVKTGELVHTSQIQDGH